MCLPDFERFEQITEDKPIVGYRSWVNPLKALHLKSTNQDYIWKSNEGPHEVLDVNSGLYSYNNYYYNNNYYNNYYNNNNNNYYYNYYNNNYYSSSQLLLYKLNGIIHQWGKVAIHRAGYRSEYARTIKLFTISEYGARGGEQKFLAWIKIFNSHVEEVAKAYNCTTIHMQDFIDENNK